MTTHRKDSKPAIMLLLAGLLGCWIAPPEAAAAPPTIQHATVDGALDKPTVREVVRAHIEEIRVCYNQELLEDETLEGRTVVSFVIEPDGSVTDANVPESTMPERFNACMIMAVETWAFPVSDDETRVSYPFDFSVE